MHLTGLLHHGNCCQTDARTAARLHVTQCHWAEWSHISYIHKEEKHDRSSRCSNSGQQPIRLVSSKNHIILDLLVCSIRLWFYELTAAVKITLFSSVGKYVYKSQSRFLQDHNQAGKGECSSCAVRWPGRDIDCFFQPLLPFLFATSFFHPPLFFSSATSFFYPRLLFFICDFLFYPGLLFSSATSFLSATF